MSDPDLDDELLRYETALAARDPHGIDGGLAGLLADDFIEFGRSGRVWTRAATLDLLDSSASALVPIDRFEVARLADDVTLVTYRAAGANRSSIWVRRNGRWRIRFHQGTATGD